MYRMKRYDYSKQAHRPVALLVGALIEQQRTLNS